MFQLIAVTFFHFLAVVVLSVPLTTFLLATITWIQQKIRKVYRSHDSKQSLSSSYYLTSAIYCGRVSHTRFRPVKHGFSYPLFFCLLDLKEVPKLFKGKWPWMWPLCYIVNFREQDHLKNKEGMASLKSCKQDGVVAVADDEYTGTEDECPLIPRIRQLVQERTGGKFVPGPDQQILLLTHLSYFGYCFNPVSFYYIMKNGQDLDPSNKINSISNSSQKGDGLDNIEAIVAEVSNTPWNEMKCYVLHPDSQDMMQVKDGMCRQKKEKTMKQQGVTSSWKSVNYIFAKKFHVSPFMDMNHVYDWTFWHLTKDDIVVSTTMKKPVDTDATGTISIHELLLSSSAEHQILDKHTETYFNAFFNITRRSFEPLFIGYQLIRFPVYCMIIQVWIHIQAFKLFVKGVEFIPHPEGSETVASRIIGNVMAPFFAFKDWWCRCKRNGTSTGSSTSSCSGQGHDKVD